MTYAMRLFLRVGSIIGWTTIECYGFVSLGPSRVMFPHQGMRHKNRVRPVHPHDADECSSTCLWGNHDDAGDEEGSNTQDSFERPPESSTGEERSLSLETLKTWSTSQILQEMDRRNIRFSPTSTRSDLITSLLMEQPMTENNNAPRLSRDSPSKSDKVGESSLYTAKDRARQPKQPTSLRQPLYQLLAELDSRNVRYPPTATREELEDLLRQSEATTRKIKQPPSQRNLGNQNENRRQRDASIRSREERRRGRRQRVHQKRTESSAPDINRFLYKTTELASNSVSKLSTVAQRAAREARRVKRRASDFWNEDEDGIREVEWEFVSKDTPIDVPATPLLDEREDPVAHSKSRRRDTMSPSTNRDRWSEGDRREGRRSETSGRRREGLSPTAGWEDPGPPQRRRARQQTNSRPRVRRTPRPRSTPPSVRKRPTLHQSGRTPLQLPPISEDTVYVPDLDSTGNVKKPTVEKATPGAPTRSKRRATRDSSKRIYAQYQSEGDDVGDFDALDRFGNFVADSADQFIWGPENVDDESFTRRPTAKRREASAQRQGRSRHWKDRLAEQVDYALGIHENGNYYNSWSTNIDNLKERDEEGEGGDSARRNEQSGRTRTPKKPSTAFWEDEGSLLTLLFGRTKAGRPLSFDRYLDNTSTTKHVTFFLRSLVKGILLVASYTCRWASVKGVIPQPIVVLFSSAALLSARPRRRIWTLALTLLAIRTVGELLHGYVYGDQDWEEDQDEQELPPPRHTASDMS